MYFQWDGAVFMGRVWNLPPGIKAAFWRAVAKSVPSLSVEKVIHDPRDGKQSTVPTGGNAEDFHGRQASPPAMRHFIHSLLTFLHATLNWVRH